MFGLGDFLTQTLIEKKKIKELEMRRIANMSAFGLCFAGPVLHLWISKGIPLLLNRIIPVFVKG